MAPRRTDHQPSLIPPAAVPPADPEQASVARAPLPYVWHCDQCQAPQVVHITAQRVLPWGIQRTRRCTACGDEFPTMERREKKAAA